AFFSQNTMLSTKPLKGGMSMTTTNNEEIRPITPADDAQVAALIRECLKAANLDKPGTVYFDTGLDHLSEFYAAKPNRQYFVAEREGQILGGVGIAEYDPAHKVAELQKFYVHGKLQGHGLGKRLLRHALAYAQQVGYQSVYLETYHTLAAAVHVYQEFGFNELPGPLITAQHSLMDQFLVKKFI
ncbi:GNAT family acetyltransferase, partial [Lacticaseibacillus paracasei subsp. paracasei Lpp125]